MSAAVHALLTVVSFRCDACQISIALRHSVPSGKCRRFDKLAMGSLLMVKILIPLLSCAVVYAALLRRQGADYMTAYLLVVMMSCVMAIRFFFQVTGEGSWQVIGTSISHYGIMNVQVVLVLLLSALASVYTRSAGSAFEQEGLASESECE